MRDMLYHTISAEHFVDCLDANSLQGRNTHRLHSNGTIPWNQNTISYRESIWYHGLCLSRCYHWAKAWKGAYSSKVVLALNRQKIKHNHRIVPYNWFESRVKSEFEEFLILANSGLTGADTLDRHESTHEARLKLINGYCGELSNLHEYVTKLELFVGEKTLDPGYTSTQDSQMQERIKEYCAQYKIPFSIVLPRMKEPAASLFT